MPIAWHATREPVASGPNQRIARHVRAAFPTAHRLKNPQMLAASHSPRATEKPKGGSSNARVTIEIQNKGRSNGE